MTNETKYFIPGLTSLISKCCGSFIQISYPTNSLCQMLLELRRVRFKWIIICDRSLDTPPFFTVPATFLYLIYHPDRWSLRYCLGTVVKSLKKLVLLVPPPGAPPMDNTSFSLLVGSSRKKSLLNLNRVSSIEVKIVLSCIDRTTTNRRQVSVRRFRLSSWASQPGWTSS